MKWSQMKCLMSGIIDSSEFDTVSNTHIFTLSQLKVEDLPGVSSASNIPQSCKVHLTTGEDGMTKRSEEYGLMVGDEPSRHFPEVEMDFDPVYDIVEFHRKFGQAYDGPPRFLPDDLHSFREKFMKEELQEYIDGVIVDDKARQLDALVDLVYVALGTAYLHGFDFREAWRRVHRANMSKVLANPEGDTRSHRDVKYDIVKPEGWVPPNHDDLVG
jgi:predicted HAD superfamily Cof-like phosphohydrolase